MASGRKPFPPGTSKPHRNSDELEERKESWQKLQASKVLKCPSELSPRAKKEWHRVMRLYNEMETDLLSDLDRQALIMYCEAVSVYGSAQAGWVMLAKNERPEASLTAEKFLKVMKRQSEVIYKLSEQLCLTPVGRARMGMSIQKAEKEDGFESIIRRRKEASG